MVDEDVLAKKGRVISNHGLPRSWLGIFFTNDIIERLRCEEIYLPNKEKTRVAYLTTTPKQSFLNGCSSVCILCNIIHVYLYT